MRPGTVVYQILDPPRDVPPILRFLAEFDPAVLPASNAHFPYTRPQLPRLPKTGIQPGDPVDHLFAAMMIRYPGVRRGRPFVLQHGRPVMPLPASPRVLQLLLPELIAANFPWWIIRAPDQRN